MTPILGPAQARSDQACIWALEKGAPEWFACDLTKLYWRYAPERGVRPEVAYAQAAHETGFGKFGRAVTREHHNFCGLKVARPVGPDDNPDDHFRFPNDHVGVIAHIDHDALYAAAPGYPRTDSPDPRHFAWILGAAATVEELSGEENPDTEPDWAPSPTYHVKIVQFIQQIIANPGVH